nr:Tetracycline_Resistance_MFS_Efflux_Pump [uncultured bacterium]
MTKQLAIILATVALAATGIGLTMPVLPDLLRDVGRSGDLGWQYGSFLALYALMQFLFAPLLGALSDRFGRRPLLLLALAGATVDYLFMAFAPTLPLLFLGRAISGITGAGSAVAAAYITDITSEPERARRFGQLSAAFGVGFIAGPAIGGLLGGHWIRAPFLAAALLSALTLAAAILALKEPKRPAVSAEPLPLNPLAPLRWALRFSGLLPLIGAFMVVSLVGEVGGTIWVPYTQERFAWDPVTVGISLTLFGLFHALAKAFLIGAISERWGERRAFIYGIGFDSAAYILIALATKGLMAFGLLPLFCLGGMAAPALQSMLTARVPQDRQGRLQGVLASLASLVSVGGPLVISLSYFGTRGTFPGIVWIGGAALYLLCLPLAAGRFSGPTPVGDNR